MPSIPNRVKPGGDGRGQDVGLILNNDTIQSYMRGGLPSLEAGR